MVAKDIIRRILTQLQNDVHPTFQTWGNSESIIGNEKQ